MKKKAINFIKMLIPLIVIILQTTLITYPKLTIAKADFNFDEKIYSTVSIDEEFDDSSVIVVLDKIISGINKVHNPDFFMGVEIDAIEDLTVVTDEIKTETAEAAEEAEAKPVKPAPKRKTAKAQA